MPNLRQPFITALAGILAALLSGTAAIALYGAQQTMPAGTAVSGWSVGGLPIEEVTGRLDRHAASLREQRIVLQLSEANPKEAAWLMNQLGLETNERAVLEALRPLREGSLWSRAKARWGMRRQTFAFAASVNEETLKQTMLRVWSKVNETPPVNAQRLVEADDSIRYVPEQNVIRIDFAALAGQLKERLPTLDPLKPDPAGSLYVNVPVTTLKPAVTLESLQAERIERKLMEFTTRFPLLNDGEGRLHNVRSTAASIHDLVMKPGEVFDYSKFIQLTEAKYGFKDAPVIVNGKLVPGIGGGICQVSSTLYNAVLRSGLKIVERRNHSLPVSYVPLGQDATFASGYINFRFQNTTGAHLLIRTETTDKEVTVKLFGSAPANVTYDVESQTLETIEPPVKYVHNPKLRPGTSELIGKGKPGYKVETYRVKKIDGQVAARELVSRDTYSPQATLMAVNNGEPIAEQRQGEQTPPYVEDGVKGPVFR